MSRSGNGWTSWKKRLNARIVGQSRAVAAVAGAIRRSRTGLGEPGRPMGAMLFLGPTGVGKTALARALAVSWFGSEKACSNLIMSEYQEQHTAARLLGAPPGYLGHDEGGQLTEAVRRRPYSVVLFDEIEKAHPDIQNILLQILEDGQLTDAMGRKADFRNTIVLLTSNLGARFWRVRARRWVLRRAAKPCLKSSLHRPLRRQKSGSGRSWQAVWTR